MHLQPQPWIQHLRHVNLRMVMELSRLRAELSHLGDSTLDTGEAGEPADLRRNVTMRLTDDNKGMRPVSVFRQNPLADMRV